MKIFFYGDGFYITPFDLHRHALGCILSTNRTNWKSPNHGTRGVCHSTQLLGSHLTIVTYTAFGSDRGPGRARPLQTMMVVNLIHVSRSWPNVFVAHLPVFGDLAVNTAEIVVVRTPKCPNKRQFALTSRTHGLFLAHTQAYNGVM